MGKVMPAPLRSEFELANDPLESFEELGLDLAVVNDCVVVEPFI